jgi:hypothetical protein
LAAAAPKKQSARLAGTLGQKWLKTLANTRVLPSLDVWSITRLVDQLILFDPRHF